MIALILGGAPSVWLELEAAKAMLTRPYVVVAANLAGIEYDHSLAGWASLHPDSLAEWVARKGSTDARLFTPDETPERWPGSSGLYAAQVALFEMGASGAVLCGVPMESSAGHFVDPGSWAGVDDYRRAFAASLPLIGGRLRSAGGWTASVFGGPTPEWVVAIDNIKPAARST